MKTTKPTKEVDEEHEIKVSDNIPVFTKPYKVAEKCKLKVREEIARLLSEGILQRSESKYASRAFQILKRMEASGS